MNFSSPLRLCAIPFEVLAAFFSKLAAMPVKPQVAVPRPTRPPVCPFCGGAGKRNEGILVDCDCHAADCWGTRLLGGPGRACAVCSGTCVVPAATVRARLKTDCWLRPLRDYALAGRWN